MVLYDLAVAEELHAYVVVVAAAAVDAVVVVVAEAHVVFVDVAFVWQTDNCDLGRKSHLHHQTTRN